ncbi:response regulator, partial [Myxococcota bacterium]|nr:response regulator [Myxococcota bacterium]
DLGAELVLAESALRVLEVLDRQPVDCVVLDLVLGDLSGFELLDRLDAQKGTRLPVIVYSGRELSRDEEAWLRRRAETLIVKGPKGPERLKNEVERFLTSLDRAPLPAPPRASVRRDEAELLAGKKVLVVDDDMRNLFSLAALLAEEQVVVVEAESGREALEVLERHPDVGAVLMDVMMPEMDGLEATRRIRANPALAHLPIIAMTAKALKGDREACLAAGVDDYVAKPLDPAQVLSLLRVWLYPRDRGAPKEAP